MIEGARPLPPGGQGRADRRGDQPVPRRVPERAVEFLLVGGGIASGNCARHLREQGADGEILLVGREPDPPYNRPPLSKEYLRGEESREDILFRPDEWYEEQRVEVLTRTSVMSLDLDARVAKLSNKEEVRFEKALLATGSNVRILRVDGAQLDGIHYLRTIGQLRRAARGARPGRARRADRRQLHRHRAGGLVHGARQAVRADHARGGHARALRTAPRSAASSRTCSPSTA